MSQTIEMEIATGASKSMWSFLDNFSPELFTFGFDPEILTAFWGLLRGGHEAPSAPRYIPTAKYQILVPFQNYSSENGVLSLIHSAVATGSMVFLVSLSSYGVYTVLQSYRKGTSSDSPRIAFSAFNGPDLKGKEVMESPARIERPTSLNVGKRSVHSVGKFDIRSMFRSKSLLDGDFDLDNVEDMGDIQGEYFGPASLDDVIDDSAGSSDFQTPCA